MKALITLLWVLHWLPLPILGRLGETVGSLLFTIMRSRRRVTLINLRLCMPALLEAQRRQIAKQHFQDYARSILERGVLWWAPQRRLRQLITIDTAAPLEIYIGKPLIFLCPHFVCLDVAGVAIALDHPACSMYTPQRNPEFDHALRKGRERFQPVKLFSRADGIKPVIRAMRQGLPFFMLPDMDFGMQNATFATFFGVPAATLTATARIAAATNAVVVPVIATYLPNYQGWQVHFYPAWVDYPGDDIQVATQRMNNFIEEQVRVEPAQYLWTHKRFKTRPPGQADVYARAL